MLSLFARYATVGILNTAVHWVAFLVFFYLLEGQQALSNFFAFCIAVTFSFVVNAKFTFRQNVTSGRYIAYIVFMGTVSVVVGVVAEMLGLPPLFTLVFFSVLSLALGFLFSKLFVFSENK